MRQYPALGKGTVPVQKLSVAGRRFVGRRAVIDSRARRDAGHLGYRDGSDTPATGGGQVFPSEKPSPEDRLSVTAASSSVHAADDHRQSAAAHCYYWCLRIT